jgi:DNA-binding response OmpR family regulator
MLELGLFIKAAREQKGITVRQAEKLSGISNAYLSQIETGKIQKPSPEILHKLSRLYMLPYEMLMEKAGHPIPDFGTIPEGVSDHCINLLIVDDSPEYRELIKIYLANDQDRIYCSYDAATGEEALAMLSENVPDCVLLDYKLPDIDGLSVYEQMKKNTSMKDTSVIMLTGYGNEEIAVKALRMGAVNYINKNAMTPEKLISAVLNAVKRKKIRESLKLSSQEKKNEINYLYNSVNTITDDIKSAFERIIKTNTELLNDPDAVLINGKLTELRTIISQEIAEKASRNPRKNGDNNE